MVSETTAEKYFQLDPDVRLMVEVRADNAAAFEELVSRYQNRLVTVMHHLVGHRDQAEDLAQEVFMRVFRARHRYQPGSRFSTWLFTIASNVASNARRSLARRREIQIKPADSDASAAWGLENLAQAASGQMPARQLDKAEISDVVQLAMQSLNDRQRMAILLCKFEGMSYAEIGESMELSPQAIKSLLSRARGHLRSVLEPYMRDGRQPPNATSAYRAN